MSARSRGSREGLVAGCEQHCGERRHTRWRPVRERSRKRSDTVVAGPLTEQECAAKRPNGMADGEGTSKGGEPPKLDTGNRFSSCIDNDHGWLPSRVWFWDS